jgi:hypothetical protein
VTVVDISETINDIREGMIVISDATINFCVSTTCMHNKCETRVRLVLVSVYYRHNLQGIGSYCTSFWMPCIY